MFPPAPDDLILDHWMISLNAAFTQLGSKVICDLMSALPCSDVNNANRVLHRTFTFTVGLCSATISVAFAKKTHRLSCAVCRLLPIRQSQRQFGSIAWSESDMHIRDAHVDPFDGGVPLFARVVGTVVDHAIELGAEVVQLAAVPKRPPLHVDAHAAVVAGHQVDVVHLLHVTGVGSCAWEPAESLFVFNDTISSLSSFLHLCWVQHNCINKNAMFFILSLHSIQL